jgi:hypothetical protein
MVSLLLFTLFVNVLFFALFKVSLTKERARGARDSVTMTDEDGNPTSSTSQKISDVCIIFNYLIYIHIVGTCFSAFACLETPSGKSILRRDVRHECDSSDYAPYQAMAVFGMIAGVLGIPLGFNRVVNYAKKRAEDEGKSLVVSKQFEVLHAIYKPEKWYTESVVCIEKATVAGVLVFLPPGNLQIGLGAMICAAWLAYYAFDAPFKSWDACLLKNIVMVAQTFLLIIAFLLKNFDQAKYDLNKQQYTTEACDVMLFIVILFTVTMVLKPLFNWPKCCSPPPDEGKAEEEMKEKVFGGGNKVDAAPSADASPTAVNPDANPASGEAQKEV